MVVVVGSPQHEELKKGAAVLGRARTAAVEHEVRDGDLAAPPFTPSEESTELA